MAKKKTERSNRNAAIPVKQEPEGAEYYDERHICSGSKSEAFTRLLFAQTGLPNWLGGLYKEAGFPLAPAASGFLSGISPRDEVEAMLAVHMFTVHNALILCADRAAHEGIDLDGRQRYLDQTNKLARTYTAQVEALSRYRGKGQQQVTVKYVHVSEGGQAIVGNVQHGAVDGGDATKRGQRDAEQLTDAHLTPMPCPDPEGDSVSVASDAERAVPDARRKVARRAKG